MRGSSDGSAPRSEDALLASLRAGDEQAFAGIVDGWSGAMLRVCRAYVPTDSAAEEVVQETWLAVIEGLPRFRGDSSLRTWVWSILVNQARNRGTRERRTVPFASLGPEDVGVSVDPSRFQGPDERYPGGWRQFPADWPEDALLAAEVQAVVHAAVAALPARQRAVVTLRDIEGYSAEEVSTLLQVTQGNQRVLLHRGRTGVRAHLEHAFAARTAADVTS
jgi:RNA polymerase sigma-70 factor, ECF subfamily